jgi:2'-5' RNA ligase
MSKDNIKKDFRKLLIESDGNSYSYGCVMLDLNISKADWQTFQDEILDDDIYTEEGDNSYGRGKTPHVTILYGLHATISDDTVKELVDEIVSPEIKLYKISIFEQEMYDVVKFDIVGDSKAKLSKLNTKFAKLPHTNDYPDYKPHATIAYVKSGTGKKYIREVTEDSITLKPNTVLYSKADGTEIKYKLK